MIRNKHAETCDKRENYADATGNRQNYSKVILSFLVSAESLIIFLNTDWKCWSVCGGHGEGRKDNGPGEAMLFLHINNNKTPQHITSKSKF